MKEYKFKYMNDAMKEEINELLKGEHGEALYAWSQECAVVAVEGFKKGIRSGVAKGLILGCAVIGAADIIGNIYKYRKMRKAEKKALKDAELEKQTYKVAVDTTMADSVEEAE